MVAGGDVGKIGGVGAGDYAEAAFFERGIIEVEDSGDHGVLVVGEEGFVLVEGEGGAFFGRLDEHFGVVELDVGADDVLGDAGEAGVGDEAGDGTGVELDIVGVEEGGLLAHGDFFGAAPGGVDVFDFLEARGEVVDFGAVGGGLFFAEESLDDDVAIGVVEILLFIGEAGGAMCLADGGHGFGS